MFTKLQHHWNGSDVVRRDCNATIERGCSGDAEKGGWLVLYMKEQS